MVEKESLNSDTMEDSGTYVWVTFFDEKKEAINCCYGSEAPSDLVAEKISSSDLRYQTFLEEFERTQVKKWRIDRLDQLHALAHIFATHQPNPVYRGQKDYTWGLETRLERDASSKHLRDNMEEFEFQKLAEAKRRLHHYMTPLPDDDDILSWIALLRHNNVPTRLLDITKSLYIACYFAVRHAETGKDAALWIFPEMRIRSQFHNWCRHKRNILRQDFPYFEFANYRMAFPKNQNLKKFDFSFEQLQIYPEHEDELDPNKVLFAALYGRIEQPGIAMAESFWLSKRMDVQQGSFLIPFNSRKPFEDNLFSFLNIDPNQDLKSDAGETDIPEKRAIVLALGNSPLIKIRLPASLHSDISVMLQNMNLRDLTLFPDQEGAMLHISEWRY